VPGAEEVYAGVVAAADAVQGKGIAAEGVEDGIFVVGSYVDCACLRERGARGVGEEGW
jgi:hypothetical protein